MWILYAFIAAILWGLDYALTGKVLEKIRLPTLLSIELFCAFLAMLTLAVLTGSYKTDLPELFGSKRLVLYVLTIVVAFSVANAFIVVSIGERNATLAGLVEISYPLFIALFSWLLFGRTGLSLGANIGGVLILLGVSLIYFFNK
jgi:drug/metabolite transporter (DMT)-like permease